ncbi:AraC family transcriptional regulator [Flavobacterium zepuense]|uniref:AraC family transcriptional regulator n=1 Tax=Flavobacterium zepuense TaxID=2593302 RepID=A0A552V410_9FLAO|nr:helix-turn-helix domain-containing protein [Flavobacterium zepuense]TRW25188.1 AraC family transcriptional regulator [Flavobacterium zepuense]
MIKSSAIYIFILLLFYNTLNAQENSEALQKRSYDYLQEKIDSFDADTTGLGAYQNALLAKAKKEHNYEKMAVAYENIAFSVSEDVSLQYADSIIIAAKRTHDKATIGSGYLTKGIIYYIKKQYKKALDHYIIANDYIANTNNAYLKHKVKYSIANIKFYLGFYDEAAILFKDCSDYFINESDLGYLNSMHSLSLCYNKLGKYSLCTATNNVALQKAKETGNKLSESYIYHSEGVNQFSLKDYTEAIKNINNSLPEIIKNEDFANETVGYFYLGKSYLALKDWDKALSYFKKVDKAFSEKNYIRPDLRENYEILINYYKQQEDTKLQLHYINKLIKADSILNINYKYLSGKIYKEYDTKALLTAKVNIEKQLAGKEHLSVILYIAIAILFVIVMVLLYRYYTNQQMYRMRFEELMHYRDEATTPQTPVVEDFETPEKNTESKKPDINPEVIAAILKQLEKFEAQKKFLQKDLTLVNLASAFNTNANYLSKVISYYRDKNYINYLNDLRIDYIINLLKTETKYRNYTIKALAAEAGFSTAQHFSKAFFTRTGIYPSYFVNELNKEYELT